MIGRAKITAGVAMLALALGACAGTPTELALLSLGGDVRAEAAPPGSGYDYIVYIRNVVDFAYDLEVRSDRYEVALLAVEEECPSAEVVAESFVQHRMYFDRPIRTYSVAVRCT
jgi:hypothetical protein